MSYKDKTPWTCLGLLRLDKDAMHCIRTLSKNTTEVQCKGANFYKDRKNRGVFYSHILLGNISISSYVAKEAYLGEMTTQETF